MKALNIEDLLQGPKKVEVPVPGRTVKNKAGMPEIAKMAFWIRPARQSERDLAAAAARKESRTLRKSLEDPKSEEHQRLVVDDLEGAEIDSLRAVWVNSKVIERALKIKSASLEDRVYVEAPESEFTTNKEMDEYEQAVEDAEDDREMSVMEAVKAAQAELEKEVKKVPDTEIMALVVPAQIESVLQQAYETEFVLQLIYRCTFSDKACTKKAFSNMEQCYQLKEQPVTILTNAHMSLLVDPEAVKNLAGGLNR